MGAHLGPVLALDGRLHRDARPAAAHRQADDRPHQRRCVGGGNELQMACDLSVIVDDGYIRHVGPEHGSVPAGGATQWLPLIVGRPAGARDHHAVRAGPAGPGAGVGAGLAGRVSRASLTRSWPSWPRSSPASCPRRCATRRPSSTGGATSSGRRPCSTPETGWRSTPPPTRRARRSPPSTRSVRRASPSCDAWRRARGARARPAALPGCRRRTVLRGVRCGAAEPVGWRLMPSFVYTYIRRGHGGAR